MMPLFGMTEENARTIAAEVGTAIGRWRDAAARYGLTPDEAERMSSAFEHEGLNAVIRSKMAWLNSGCSA